MDKFKDSMRNIMTFHKRSKYEEDENPRMVQAEKAPPKKKKPFTLPHWTIYIAWTREIFFTFQFRLYHCQYF